MLRCDLPDEELRLFGRELSVYQTALSELSVLEDTSPGRGLLLRLLDLHSRRLNLPFLEIIHECDLRLAGLLLVRDWLSRVLLGESLRLAFSVMVTSRLFEETSELNKDW